MGPVECGFWPLLCLHTLHLHFSFTLMLIHLLIDSVGWFYIFRRRYLSCMSLCLIDRCWLFPDGVLDFIVASSSLADFTWSCSCTISSSLASSCALILGNKFFTLLAFSNIIVFNSFSYKIESVYIVFYIVDNFALLNCAILHNVYYRHPLIQTHCLLSFL